MSNGEPTSATSYEVVGKLADGDVAELFLAKATGAGALERLVVVKRVPRKVTQNTDLVRAFLDEARLAARLQHPNIAQVFEVGKLGGSYFFSMEFVNGETLRSLVEHAKAKKIQVPIRSIVTIAAGAAAGMHHAHERKGIDGASLDLVHADISPTNLLVSREGIVKLVDFGIAKARGRSSAQLPADKVSYWSPEQARGEPLDRRSDLFSLGVVLWELITLEDLYHRGGDAKSRAALENEPPIAPSTRRYDVPPELDALIVRLLAKNPADRYQDADDLLAALEGLASKLGFQLSTAELARMMRLWFGNVGDPVVPPTDKPLIVTSEPVPDDLALASDPIDELLDTVRSATELLRNATALAGERGRPSTGAPLVGDAVESTREDFAQIRDRILEQARKKKETMRPSTQPPPIAEASGGVVAAPGAGDASTRTKRETLNSTSNAYSFITDVSGKAAAPIRKLGITSTPQDGAPQVEMGGMTSAAAATEALVKGQAAAAAAQTAARVEAARAAATAKAEEAAKADEEARAAASALRAEAMARADEKARAAAAKSDAVKSDAARAAVTTPATGIPTADATGPATAAEIITSPTAGPSEPGETKVVVAGSSEVAPTSADAEAKVGGTDASSGAPDATGAKESSSDAANAAPEAKADVTPPVEAQADTTEQKPDGSDAKVDAKADGSDAKVDSADAASSDGTDAAVAAKAESTDAANPDSKDANAGSKVAKPDANDAKADIRDAKADANDSKPDAKDAKPDSKDARESSRGREAPPASSRSAVRAATPRPALDTDDDLPRRPAWVIPAALAAAALVVVVLVKVMGSGDDKKRPPQTASRNTNVAATNTPVAPGAPSGGTNQFGISSGGATHVGSATVDTAAAPTTNAGSAAAGSAVQVATNNTTQDPAGTDTTTSTAADKPPGDKPDDNVTTNNKATGNDVTATKPATTKPTGNNVTTTNKPTGDNVTAKKPATNKPTGDNVTARKPATDKPAADADAATSIEDLVAAAQFSKANDACKKNTIFNSTRLTACTLAACNVKDAGLAKRWVRAIEKAARPDLVKTCSTMGVEIGDAPTAQPAAAPAPPPDAEPAPTP